MSGRTIRILKQALLSSAASLLMICHLPAGEHVRAGKPSVIRSPSPPALARGAQLPDTVSVVVTTQPQLAPAPVYVDVRGPDGQLRRFSVEGGRAAIQYRQVILHAGEMVTIHWTTAK